MSSKLIELEKRGLIKPPHFVISGLQYETIMGSVAYATSTDDSDLDIYGFTIPPKEDIFPHLKGEINGFGRQKQRFEQFEICHVNDKDALGGKGQEVDFNIYNIVKYFSLLMDNNPNIIDSIYTPNTCVLHQTQVGQMVREKRKIFLHKGAWFKFKGYSFAQMNKISNKNPIGKRLETVQKYGWDVKYGVHLVRLLNEIEMILIEGDLDLTRNNEQLKSIRRGEWTEVQIRQYFADKEKDLEKIYLESKLPHSPDENKIKQLLLNCLEHHYGNLDKCIVNVDRATQCLRDIKKLIERSGI